MLTVKQQSTLYAFTINSMLLWHAFSSLCVHGEDRPHCVLWPPKGWFGSARVHHIQQNLRSVFFFYYMYSRRHSPFTSRYAAYGTTGRLLGRLQRWSRTRWIWHERGWRLGTAGRSEERDEEGTLKLNADHGRV